MLRNVAGPCASQYIYIYIIKIFHMEGKYDQGPIYIVIIYDQKLAKSEIYQVFAYVGPASTFDSYTCKN